MLVRQDTGEQAHAILQDYIDLLCQWTNKWKIRLNASKTSMVCFTYKRNVLAPDLVLNGEQVGRHDSVRYLGVTLDSKLNWNLHINALVGTIRGKIRKLKYLLASEVIPLHLKRILYLSLLRPVWQYACEIWCSAANTQIKRIQTIQNRILRIITGAPWFVRNATLHADLDIPLVVDILSMSYNNFASRTSNHRNPLVSSMLDQPRTPRDQRRLKRKWHSDLLSTTPP